MIISKKEAKIILEGNIKLRAKFSESDANLIINKYRQNYPFINFNLRWNIEEPNAYAYIDKSIDIYEGIFNKSGMSEEGIGLGIAHEIGHIIGGEPRQSNGLSCESQADYYGAGVIMKEVWGMSNYENVMNEAIRQFALFIKTPNINYEPSGSCDCKQHASSACRISIFYNAKNDLPKPDCSIPNRFNRLIKSIINIFTLK